MVNYRYCVHAGHWKHERVCDKKLVDGKCIRVKGSCKPREREGGGKK
jgi:hypothetical protein